MDILKGNWYVGPGRYTITITGVSDDGVEYMSTKSVYVDFS